MKKKQKYYIVLRAFGNLEYKMEVSLEEYRNPRRFFHLIHKKPIDPYYAGDDTALIHQSYFNKARFEWFGKTKEYTRWPLYEFVCLDP